MDLGGRHPYPSPQVGQNVGSVSVEGIETVVWARGSVERRQNVRFFIRAWQAVGGQAADTGWALRYLTKQVEELASNAAMQAVYIQWTATNQPLQIVNAVEIHDGWYLIDDFEADYHGIDFPVPIADCRMTVTEVAPAAPRSVAMAYTGGALSTNFSGGSSNLISLPSSATALEASFNRTGGDGIIPCINPPVASPEPFTPSATIADYWHGCVHVFDTLF